ncbi:MAG: TlpA family protein disulfide reductase [Candidatus Binatia bacterium]
MKIPSLASARRLIWLPLVSGLFLGATSAVPQPVAHDAEDTQTVGRNVAPKTGEAAIEFDLKTLDGQSVRLDTFRGKPLMINFFATWCDPCREEMPLINTLASKAARNGYSVLGIAVQDSRSAVTEFAREAGLVFPLALDLNSKVQRAYRIFGPPATFFIDGEGVLRDTVLGPLTPERAREALEKAGVRR